MKLKHKLAALSAAIVGTVSTAAMADGGTYLPTAGTSMFSQLTTDFGTVSGLGGTLLVLTVGTFIGYKWIRKAGNKAS